MRTASQMSVDAHVPCSTAETFPLPVGNMLLRLGITVLLSHAKIDNVDDFWWS